jgi:hypothetical protein
MGTTLMLYKAAHSGGMSPEPSITMCSMSGYSLLDDLARLPILDPNRQIWHYGNSMLTALGMDI